MSDRYSAMAVNERLYISGLIKNFDVAVQEKNVDRIVSLLKEVDFTDLSIDPILAQMGLKRKIS